MSFDSQHPLRLKRHFFGEIQSIIILMLPDSDKFHGTVNTKCGM